MRTAFPDGPGAYTRALAANAHARILATVKFLAEVKNVPPIACNPEAIADTVLGSLDAAGLLAFMAKPGSSENRGLLSGINNCLDWGAAVAMVLAFAEGIDRDVRPGELGVLTSHVLDLAKGGNPPSAPTYRWPDTETVKAIAAASAAQYRPRTSAEFAAVLTSTSSAWRPESLQPVFRDAASA